MPALTYFGFLKSALVNSDIPQLQLYIMPVDPFVEDFPKLPNLSPEVKIISTVLLLCENNYLVNFRP